MKAFILAAGFGTRLLPYTKEIPKPLFSLCGTPLIKRIINSLEICGFTEIFINTHHLGSQIKKYIESEKFDSKITIIHEQDILNTGGGISNVLEFMEDKPFLVVNSDIYTNIDFKKVYDFHLNSKNPATLCVLKNRFNNVEIENSLVKKFDKNFSDKNYTFTGIQVIDPKAGNFFEANQSSINAYEKMIKSGFEINAFIPDDSAFFDDLGTIESFKNKSLELLLKNDSTDDFNTFELENLKGDGSDRTWSRIKGKNKTLILSDHGITAQIKNSQVKSFVEIGRHLYEKKVKVPEIISYDYFSGLVLTQDLGDERLEDYIKKISEDEKEKIFKKVIKELLKFSIEGKKDFKNSMTYQTFAYDKKMSLTECLYFKNEFLDNFINLNYDEKKLLNAFDFISSKAVEKPFTGLMHRDFQSRNIMIKEDSAYIIDFQGARTGPLQYDLASFLIDPYLDLEQDTQKNLLNFALKELKIEKNSINDFITTYKYCALSRNLHILGAFSFLSLKKNKQYFKNYIPAALKSLNNIIRSIPEKEILYLKETESKISRSI